MDMVDHEDKIMVILDNSDLVIIDKSTGDSDTIELNYNESPTCMTKVKDRLIIGATNGVVYNVHIADLMTPIELPKPPAFGEGASDTPEKIQYPDAKVIKATNKYLSVLFLNKTMMFYDISKLDEISIMQTIKSHVGAIYAIDTYPSTGDPYKFWFVTGSTDKTLRRWIVSSDKRTFSCQINQDGIGLLWDDFEHLKSK